MKSYQDELFTQLEQALEPYERVRAVVQYDFSNVGTLMQMDGIFTIESWHFDVQRNRVSIRRGDRSSGPRQGGVFWWDPSKPEDNAEVARFLEEWTDTASAYVTSKAM